VGTDPDLTVDASTGDANWLGISENRLYFRIESLPMTKSIGEEFKIVALSSITTYLFKVSEK
jgi:hypothetical protein